MKRLLASLLLLIVVASNVAAAEPPRDLVLAYYYPWYLKGDWTRHGYFGEPTLGNYGTDDPQIAEQHIRWGKEAGLDGFVVSWGGPQDMTDKHFRAGYLKSENSADLKYAFIYESLGRLDGADGKTNERIDFSNRRVVRRFQEDLAYLNKQFCGDDRYLKVDGRPVIVLYVTRTFRNFNAEILKKIEEEVGQKFYFIADESFILGEQKDPATAENGLRDGKPLFDAYTAYNMFESDLVKEGEPAVDYMRREAIPVFQTWSAETVFCPTLMPKYHDFRGKRTLTGTPAEYKSMVAMMQALPKKPVGHGIGAIYLITSWNEWWEGTTIEPDTTDGKAFLEANREAFGR
ncbi:glycoside hydrolase family 99-like domain-containing protein [Blastopirellula sp. JC732]|uniref:Glycoside hydrolase family 99-like domain-containing protein n=1 Tax=Blastopirellula sediminis TaxID=2894196 RepID=A0A9X1SHJ9_9BACT|nr:glycoside hydrolase family 99-like domain-containing protein [Blastopirellula sediminis]MCC9606480.1 glycoside hydrolase family 99-like domain-containing protein [Blastopirellula sediminis]MCC9630222.1 glycoside hydrolase family 99-like domain-containing protein [Blastopirellula sediminis]